MWYVHYYGQLTHLTTTSDGVIVTVGWIADQIGSALQAPEIPGDMVKRRPIRFWEKLGYN